MNVIYLIVFGLIAGTAANFIRPNLRGGIIKSTALGIMGAVIGGYLGLRFFGAGFDGLYLMSFMFAMTGSVVVMYSEQWAS